jgi:hypothetical protein
VLENADVSPSERWNKIHYGEIGFPLLPQDPKDRARARRRFP